ACPRRFRLTSTSNFLFLSLCSVATAGILSNSLLLYTTIATKSLRSSCNILIGLCVFFDMCHNCGALIHFPQAVFKFYIDSSLCSAIQVRLCAIAVYCSYTPYLMHEYFVAQPIIFTVTSVFHGEAAKL
ncbi:hypothetical protein PENTCL1PPCAC_16234, partial [Pristionchus entomophagus]